MAFSPGSRIGPYEVTGSLGAGGMGEVYRARDARLNRDVAIKVLPAALAADSERPARFAREAQLLASLNHPNIAHVHGIVDLPGDDGSIALVMELVDGPTLADRLRRGRIPLDEAMPIARQLIDAIEAAHAQGVVHRDLKPANIKVRDDGTVKVLDFGLAKLAAPEGGEAEAALANSPTLTAQSSELGVILGTAAYMAPEQARGKPADKRADIWAFGVVLYEMLSGRRLFGGDTTSEVLAGVLKEQPDWKALPSDTPVSIRRLLARCLEKDPKRRLRDIGDARLDLEDTSDSTRVEPPASRRPSIGWLIGASIAGAAVVAAGVILALPRLRPAPDTTIQRVSVLPPPGMRLFMDSADHAISPDGRKVVFRTGTLGQGSRLWLRVLDAETPKALDGTADAFLPFWSPDSTAIAFFQDGKLKTMSLASGAVTVVCSAPDGRGGSWSPSGTIVFAPSNAVGLMRVSAAGGDPQSISALDASRQETAHRFPWFLPDGRHFLYVALSKRDRFDIYAASVDGGERKLITTAASGVVYTAPGYLLFMRPNGLAAQPFDADSLAPHGEPIPLPDIPGATGAEWLGGWPVTASRDGRLLYLGGAVRRTRLAWFDLASGNETGTVSVPEGYYQYVALSPDDKRVAVARIASPTQGEIWVIDLVRGAATKVTDGTDLDVAPVWSPDGARLAYLKERNGISEIHARTIIGGADETLLADAGLFVEIEQWTRDGKMILFSKLDAETQRDIWVLPLDGDRKPWAYLKTRILETRARLSRDGRYVSYLAREAGSPDVFVQSFPKPGDKYAVTSGGAAFGGFEDDGVLIYALPGNPRVYAVDVTGSSPLQFGPPRLVGTLPDGVIAASATADHKRLLAAVPADRGGVTSLTLVNNWRAALARQP